MITDLLDIVLLDTDVFSYLMEPGDPRGLPYLRHVEGRTTALSFITVWIAALAVRHSVPLVSNNRKHFKRVPGLVLISEAPR